MYPINSTNHERSQKYIAYSYPIYRSVDYDKCTAINFYFSDKRIMR